MGSFTHELDIPTVIAPTRLFKAFVGHDPRENGNVLLKAIPELIEKVDIISGNGGPGSVHKVYFAAASQFKYMVLQTDAVDSQNLRYGYSVIEGDVFQDMLEKISYDIKFEANQDGGSIVKKKVTYYRKDGVEMNEHEFWLGEEKVISGLYEAVEAYLVANPDAWN